ncbi:MAG: primosomal protein N' [Pseudomonadota bacterium]|nr:primosomal protein N' [Pseudomonadota bacterium]
MMTTFYRMRISGTSSTDQFHTGAKRVRVLLPLPLLGPYEYRVPADLSVIPGDFVQVPLGKQVRIGVVWDPVKTIADVPAEAINDSQLRDIEARLDPWRLSESMRRFVDWVAAYSMVAPGAILRMTMSIPEALIPRRPRIVFHLPEVLPDFRETPARKRVLEILREGPARGVTELAREAAVGIGVVRGLSVLGVIDSIEVSEDALVQQPDPSLPGPTLSEEQWTAATELAGRAETAEFSVALLDGVTGSGKTEVYFEAIAAALAANRQVLVLLPEIALTAQFLERFETRFGTFPEEWHSDVLRARRRRVWRAVADGRARVVVGARSALFLPFRELGLIVVDEEHDLSYKQEDGVIYHARDMAVVRARMEEISVVLVSATPSLETWINVEQGRYSRFHLPARYGRADLPEISLVDLRCDSPQRQCWLSLPLREAVTESLAAEEQSLLFLNRRGYAPLTLCRACGHRLACPNCTSWLVEHRFQGRLNCHHCGYSIRMPKTCPECGAEDRMVACGPGVERLAEEVELLHPDARVELMTSDTIFSSSAAAEIVRRVQAHEVDILIGTQLVAKGHHFPNLTLVGVIDGDLGLAGGDLRAAERTYQLLHQVAGRAGREDRPGRVLLQTHHPEHPVMKALQDGARDAFMAAEAEQRKRGSWPPFGRLAAIVVSGPDESDVETFARSLALNAPQAQNFKVLGPAPAPLALLRGRHRRRLLVRTTRSVRIQERLRPWIASVKPLKAVRVQVDIDPYSFL